MVRELTIEFNTGDWYIESGEDVDGDALQEINGASREGKILYIHSFGWVMHGEIEAAKKNAMYKEMCRFRDVTGGKEFAGTFIDALEYIDRELERYRETWWGTKSPNGKRI